ncbi:MAG: glycoside hydrolase family 2 TIM barrel-domain containing protein [Clostridia bacterium]|nr:glycoside hydrolase family 2 TIM barrel-domain containing protein [Clostridia bacterium]
MNRTVLKREPVVVNPLYKNPMEKRMSLSGEWRFRLDPGDEGLKQKWFLYPYTLLESINVPGCWQGQGFGGNGTTQHKETDVPVQTFKATYVGTGWYGRAFTVPEHWVGKRIWLNFGGISPSAQIWLNGVHIGDHHFPYVPFALDITDYINANENFVTVRVHEQDRMLELEYYGEGMWSGLYRDVELTATDDAYIEQLQVISDVDAGMVKVYIKTSDVKGEFSVKLTIIPIQGGTVQQAKLHITNGEAQLELPIDNPQLWCPETPNLYRIDIQLLSGEDICDAVSDRFGLVKLSVEGKHFMINNKPYFMRGGGEFFVMTDTGSPDTNRNSWRKRLRTLREYGYNYIRLQSHAQITEYYDAADEVGLLIQSEMGTMGPICGFSAWHTYNMYPKPTPDFRERFRHQWNMVVKRDVNHPSANLYCMSNELTPDMGALFPRVAWRCYRETKEYKPTALVIWTDGQYSPDMPGDYVNAEAKIDVDCPKPVIQHEFRWWSSYLDVRTAVKFKGAMRPYALEYVVNAAAKSNILHTLIDATKNSQRLQFVEMKGKLEGCRRDNGTLAGISHFNATDTAFSAQGVLDMFYEKKYATPEQWLQTNGDVIIMTSLNFNNRCYQFGDTFECELSISDYAHPALKSPVLKWSIEVNGISIASNIIRYAHKPYGTCPAGCVRAVIPDLSKPVCAKLKAWLSDDERTYMNEWDLWFFPETTNLPQGIVQLEDSNVFPEDAKTILTLKLTPELAEFVKSGGNVILYSSEGLVRPFLPVLGLDTGRYFFLKPANFPPFEELQAGTIIVDHPMFGDFPHEGFADLQFYNMLGESPAFDIGSLGLNDVDPVIRMMHSSMVARPLASLVERSIGKGRIIMLALDMNKAHPEAYYLLRQICLYTISDNKPDCAQMSQETLDMILAACAM